jgi:hypothetical protein
VREEFSNSPFDGWIQALNCALPVKAPEAQQTESEQPTAGHAPAQVHLSLRKLIEETSDRIIVEKLL